MEAMDRCGLTIEQVIGRTASLCSKFQVTAAQSKAWNAFASALRDNTHLQKEAGTTRRADALAPNLLAQMEIQERVLAARLKGIRKIKTALTALFEALTPDQRKMADELLSPETGLKLAGMKEGSMMPTERPGRVDRLLGQSPDSSVRLAWPEAAASQVALLTPRQRQIMELILAGQPSKNIAADIGISQRTVENHRASIMKRTGSKSLPALARLAFVASWNGTAHPSV